MNYLRSLLGRLKSLIGPHTTKINNLARPFVGLAFFLLKLCFAFSFVSLLFYFIVNAEDIHSDIVYKNIVGSRVFHIADETKHGGTAFLIISPEDGVTYLMTNDHICTGPAIRRFSIWNDAGASAITSIIRRSIHTDLCILENPFKDVPGLELSYGTERGAHIRTVGHPNGDQLTISNKGEIISVRSEVLTFDDDVESSSYVKEKCDLTNPKFKVNKFNQCLLFLRAAFQTNLNIKFGSSGSPVVDKVGDVVGVVAGKDEYNWAIVVPLREISIFFKE